MIKYPQNVNMNEFDKSSNNYKAKYGLPQSVIFCKNCVISNQRPNSTIEHKHTRETKKLTIAIHENGLCDACIFAYKKNNEIDWVERERKLIELCEKYRSRNGHYDCLVPGSGGKDSIYASHILKNKYGMHPLTVTWAPHMYTDWGWKNHQAWIHSGFDNYLMTPNGNIHRLLTRLSLENLLHPFQPFIMGQKSLAPKMAQLFNIPLVFYGENESEYGNPIGDNSKSKRDTAYFGRNSEDEVFLAGTSVADLKEKYALSHQDLLPYLPMNFSKLTELNIEVHYLGYYLKWHPQGCYYYAAENTGFQAAPERTPGTYSKYNGIDDKIDDFHYYTTGIKFGLGRASYDASQEIRSGDITRDEGVVLVNKFDHEFPKRFATEIFKYLSISNKKFHIAAKQFEQPTMDLEYFHKLCDQFRSPHLWYYDDNTWQLRHTLKQDIPNHEKS
jgi:N-acetyl sugar amidotransferase